MSNNFYNFFLHKGNNNIEFYVGNAIASSYAIAFPGSAPTNGQALAYNSAIQSLEWKTFGDSNASGTVTSVGLSLPSIFAVAGSPITVDGTIAATFTSQTANRFFAAPDGSNGIPVFRGIAINDLPNIPTTKLTGVLADSQAPSGTNNSFFQIDTDGSGGRVVWDTTATEFQLKNSTGATYANLRVKNLFITGDTTTIESEVVAIADNKLLLNSNVTETPTEDSGIEIQRGTSPNSFVQWNEATDNFECGETGNLLALVRKSQGSFTNANLSANTITITHNLREQHPDLIVKNGAGVIIDFSYNPVNSNSLTIDMSRVVPLTGTWNWYAKG